jgi:hypothetical protein
VHQPHALAVLVAARLQPEQERVKLRLLPIGRERLNGRCTRGGNCGGLDGRWWPLEDNRRKGGDKERCYDRPLQGASGTEVVACRTSDAIVVD